MSPTIMDSDADIINETIAHIIKVAYDSAHPIESENASQVEMQSNAPMANRIPLSVGEGEVTGIIDQIIQRAYNTCVTTESSLNELEVDRQIELEIQSKSNVQLESDTNIIVECIDCNENENIGEEVKKMCDNERQELAESAAVECTKNEVITPSMENDKVMGEDMKTVATTECIEVCQLDVPVSSLEEISQTVITSAEVIAPTTECIEVCQLDVPVSSQEEIPSTDVLEVIALTDVIAPSEFISPIEGVTTKRYDEDRQELNERNEDHELEVSVTEVISSMEVVQSNDDINGASTKFVSSIDDVTTERCDGDRHELDESVVVERTEDYEIEVPDPSPEVIPVMEVVPSTEFIPPIEDVTTERCDRHELVESVVVERTEDYELEVPDPSSEVIPSMEVVPSNDVSNGMEVNSSTTERYDDRHELDEKVVVERTEDYKLEVPDPSSEVIPSMEVISLTEFVLPIDDVTTESCDGDRHELNESVVVERTENYELEVREDPSLSDVTPLAPIEGNEVFGEEIVTTTGCGLDRQELHEGAVGDRTEDCESDAIESTNVVPSMEAIESKDAEVEDVSTTPDIVVECIEVVPSNDQVVDHVASSKTVEQPSSDTFYNNETITQKGYVRKVIGKDRCVINSGLPSDSTSIKKVECKGLPLDIKSNELIPLLEKFGRVVELRFLAVVPGTVHVTYMTEKECETAINELNGFVIRGKPLKAIRLMEKRKLFVKNLPPEAPKSDLNRFFQRLTKGITEFFLMYSDFHPTNNRGCCAITYNDYQSAAAAYDIISKTIYSGRKLVCCWSLGPKPLHKLYMNNLRSGITIIELRRIFTAYGQVIELLKNGSWASVKFLYQSDAQRALKHIDRSLLGSRNLELSQQAIPEPIQCSSTSNSRPNVMVPQTGFVQHVDPRTVNKTTHDRRDDRQNVNPKTGSDRTIPKTGSNQHGGTKKRPEIASPRKCETKHDDNATPKTCSKDTPKQQSNDQRNRQHDITDDGFGPGERYSVNVLRALSRSSIRLDSTKPTSNSKRA